jgi:N-acetyl-anhydromuramyl-L-alanine amidase AmpD
MAGTLIAFMMLVVVTKPPAMSIINKPIIFNEKRVELTKQYIKDHYDLSVNSIEIDPKMIVLHWTADNDFNSSYHYFYEPLLNGRSDIQKASHLNVSAHFMIKRDGQIYKLMPDNVMARHVIGLNYSAIGIENVGGQNSSANLTKEQLLSNVLLIEYLTQKYPEIEYLIGHHQYQEFEDHPLWLENESSYRTTKYDPGDAFMQEIHTKVEKLNLKSHP